jgi:TonB family protein
MVKAIVLILSVRLLLSASGWAQATASNQAEASSASAELAEASKLSRQALGLYNEKRYSEALALAKRVVEIREKRLGSQHELVVAALSDVAEIHIAETKYNEAESLYKRVLTILENKWGKESTHLVFTIKRLGLVMFAQQDFGAAEKHYLRALAITEKSLGPNAVETGESLEALASFYSRSDQHKKSAEFYQRSVALKEKLLAPTDTQFVNLLYTCACALVQAGQRDRATEYIERAQKRAPSDPVNQGVLQGIAILRVQPEYPFEARNTGITGTVVVEVLVDECGRVLKARSLNGHMELARAAMRAAREWRFTPTILAGRPVRVIGTITFNFIR